MAITLDYDLKEPYGSFEAIPLNEEEAARLQTFKDWRKATAEAVDLKWTMAMVRSKAPLIENEKAIFPFDEALIPKKLRVVRGTPDWDFCAQTGVAYAVSQRFKDLIEGIEPEVHEFVPFELYDKQSKKIERSYFFWRIRVQLDAVTPELGGLKMLGSGPSHGWSMVPGGQDRLAVRKERIAGHAAWYDIRYINQIFVSDRVLAGLEAQKLKGWRVVNVWKEI